jgi:hypothetical protein
MRKLKRKTPLKTQSRKKASSSQRQDQETRFDILAGASPGFDSRRAELERMLREQFPEEGKEDRIQKGLKALQEIRENPLGRDLDIETVKKIA